MNLLRTERDTLDAFLPGLDKYLSEIPLLELEQPGCGALQKFRELGGFHEQVLFAEDYLLSQQVDRKRFGIVRGGVYTTNRRFQKMGHLRVGWLFLWTAMNYWNEKYFLRDHKYWGSEPDSVPRA